MELMQQQGMNYSGYFHSPLEFEPGLAQDQHLSKIEHLHASVSARGLAALEQAHFHFFVSPQVLQLDWQSLLVGFINQIL